MRLPPRYAPLLFAFLMSFIMVFVVSAFVTWLNTGFADGYIGRWMHAFIFAWPLAMACILLFVGRVRKLTEKLTGSRPHKQEQHKTGTQHV